MLAIWSPQPNWMPRKPKLMFQMVEKRVACCPVMWPPVQALIDMGNLCRVGVSLTPAPPPRPGELGAQLPSHSRQTQFTVSSPGAAELSPVPFGSGHGPIRPHRPHPGPRAPRREHAAAGDSLPISWKGTPDLRQVGKPEHDREREGSDGPPDHAAGLPER